ncbi:serine/threonine-protein kinase [Microtetraspora malaysiensis]|uniref:serine/threonine-protein kinase n=1 Tax=Microtetraspora malaysiensis TaxID=161358 RepID=UPI003D939FE5
MLPLLADDPVRLGPYKLEGRLGEGGQGIVYLGRGPGGQRVAVKLLRPHLIGDADMRARFARELAVIERVAGFCTAQVLDADVAGGRPYIVSEYVPGPSLQQVVAENGPRVGTELQRLAVGTATALAAVHRAGIVHRDFKPANVLMGPDGPRVIDFGIARALEAGAESATASAVVGTPAYMAPEQVAGERVTAAADVFSWGATVAFAATGSPPFGTGSIPALLNRIAHLAPDLAGVPPTLGPLLARCLAKDPAARPTTEQLMLELLGERDEQPQHPGQGERLQEAAPRGRKTAVWAAAAVAGVMVLGAAGYAGVRMLPGLGAATGAAVTTGAATPEPSLNPYSGKLRTPMHLRLVTADRPAPCGESLVPSQDGKTCYQLTGDTTITEVEDLWLQEEPPVLRVTLLPADAQRFSVLSDELHRKLKEDPDAPGGGRLALVVDDRVVMAPTFAYGPIPGQAFDINGVSYGEVRSLFRQLSGR